MWCAGCQPQAHVPLWPFNSRSCPGSSIEAALISTAWERRPGAWVSRNAPKKRKQPSPRFQPTAQRKEAAELRHREGLVDLQQEQRHGGRVSIFYNTSWEQAYLHGSIQGGKWRDHNFSRVSPAGGNLWVLHLTASSNGTSTATDAPLLEFVIHNGNGDYDKPAEGGNYSVRRPGGYLLDFGTLSKVKGQAIMVVSDLDDTMFGDDEASKAFKDFWEKDARLRGSCLVYNTGRALDKWLSLWKEKSHCLAAPDVLISSVGTKIYNAAPDTFQGWTVDKEYAAKLDEGWQLELVREAAYKALVSVGKESMHFRPPEEQNSHKITLGVKNDVLPKVQSLLQKALSKGSVDAQFIISGRGEWRFLDIVSRRAGKLAALEYVRQKMGFAPKHTVAAGDSGNDKDMLGGKASSLAIVVANAEPELKQWLADEMACSRTQDRLFAAKKDMAYGILEGLEHFGFKDTTSL